MPELNVIHIAIIAAVTVIGANIGWILRGKRSEEEKAAVSAGWQEQISAQRVEHDRRWKMRPYLRSRQDRSAKRSHACAKNELGRPLPREIESAFDGQRSIGERLLGFRPDADFDGNGQVGFSDFGIFRSMFGSAPGPSGLVN